LANTPDFKRDPQLFRDHGMEVVGPPLLLDGTLPDIAQRF
jgi:hypothetical protein